jgi:hypothetical protein
METDARMPAADFIRASVKKSVDNPVTGTNTSTTFARTGYGLCKAA